MWNNLNGIAGMVIYNIQWIAVVTILHAELTFEIHLPHLIARFFFKSDKGFPLLRFLRTDAAVAVEDVVDCFCAGNIPVAICQKNVTDCPGSPAWVVSSDCQNKQFYFFRRSGRTAVRPSAPVCQWLTFLVTGLLSVFFDAFILL